jgi:hypothetical protein
LEHNVNTGSQGNRREADGTGSISSQTAGFGISGLEPANRHVTGVLTYSKLASHDYEVIETIQAVPGGKVSILGGHSIGYSKQTKLYMYVSYS